MRSRDSTGKEVEVEARGMQWVGGAFKVGVLALLETRFVGTLNSGLCYKCCGYRTISYGYIYISLINCYEKISIFFAIQITTHIIG